MNEQNVISFIQKKYIKLSNFYNRVWNIVYNNVFANAIKESIQYLIGFPYSEFLCWDNAFENGEKVYLIEMRKSYQTKFFPLRWIRLLIDSEIVTAETDLTGDSKHALDTSKIGIFKKLQLQKDVNRAFNLNKENGFKFKRLLVYYEGLTDTEK